MPQFEYHILIVVIVTTIIVLLFTSLAIWTCLLREEVNNHDEFNIALKLKGQKATYDYPFSLSKVQFGIWTVIISSAYTYLSLCEGDCAETGINKTALVLLGIFSITAASTKIIDKREIGNEIPRHQNSPSEGFFTDILSDENGISIHRFQHLIWTIVGMAVYLYKVSQITKGCVLPELSDTLLTLMGISSATFIATRSQENDGTNKQPVVNTITTYESYQPAESNNTMSDVNSTSKPVPHAIASANDNMATGTELQTGGNASAKGYEQTEIKSVSKLQEVPPNTPVPYHTKTDYSSKRNFSGSSDFYG